MARDPRRIENDRPVARNLRAENDSLHHVAGVAEGTVSDGTRLELFAAVVAAALEGVLPMTTVTTTLNIPQLEQLITRQNQEGRVYVRMQSNDEFRGALLETLRNALAQAEERHPPPRAHGRGRVATRVYAMVTLSCNIVTYEEGERAPGDDAPGEDSLMLVTERVHVMNLEAAATALANEVHNRLNVEIERYNPQRENTGTWNIDPVNPDATLRVVIFMSHAALPKTREELVAEGGEATRAMMQERGNGLNPAEAVIPFGDPLHPAREQFLRLVAAARALPPRRARAAANAAIASAYAPRGRRVGALEAGQKDALTALLESTDARSREAVVKIACGDGACAFAAFAMSIACNLLAPGNSCAMRELSSYSPASANSSTRCMRRRRVLEELVSARALADEMARARKVREVALRTANVLRVTYNEGTLQRLEADACHQRAAVARVAPTMAVDDAFALLGALPGAVVVYKLDDVSDYLASTREHRTLPEPVFTANFERSEFVNAYYDMSRIMHFFVVTDTHIASVPTLRTALFFMRRCRDCGPNVTHNVLPVKHEQCGNCDRCNGYMRLSCLPRHAQSCKGVQACEVCGTSKGPFHKCKPRFATKQTRESFLYTPDAEFDFSDEMREAAQLALEERDALRVVEAKHQEGDDAVLLTALAAQLRANMCTHPRAREFRVAIDALEERAVERFLPHIVAYDFETLSPNDAPKKTTESGTVKTGVFPVVVHAEQVRAFPGEERRKFTAVGLDCASQLVDWLGEFTRWVLSTPHAGAFTRAAFRSEPPTAEMMEAFIKREAARRGVGDFVEYPVDGYYGENDLEDAIKAATERYARREAHAKARGEEFIAPTDEEFAAMVEIERFANALREQEAWVVCLLGYNSSRFDSVFISHRLPFGAVTRLKMRASRILNVTAGYVSHADLITFTGGSLDSAVKAFAADAPTQKIATPFDYFNSFPLRAVQEAPALADFRAPFPSVDEWCVGRHARAEYEASYATLDPYKCEDEEKMWYPFKWFAYYCAVDVALLGRVAESVIKNFTRSSGVVPLLRSITIASHALAANSAHHCFAEAAAPKDMPPHALSVIERSRSGGTVCVGATVAVGPIYGDDAVSAYPSLCTNPLLVPQILPFGALRDDVPWIGNGRWGPTHTGANVRREEVTRSLRGSLERNKALDEVLASINNPESTLVGTYLVGVFVYPISPVTGQRVHLGPFRVRTKAGLVVQPVGVFYCHTGLWPLRRAVAARFCEVIEVVEGFCFPATEGGDASQASVCLRERGGCAYPATRDGLLNKWYTTGLPPTMTPVEVETFCGKLSRYFCRPVRPESFVKNAQACRTYKLQVNCSWGANARGKSDELYVVRGPALLAVTSVLWAQRYGIPMSLNPVLEPDPREMEAIVNYVASREYPSPEARTEHARQLAFARSKQLIPVEPTTATRAHGSTMMPLTRSPALATGLAVPDAMRHILFCVWQALTALGCKVIYSDTDSVKYLLPDGVTDPELRRRMQRARETNPWFRELIKYTEWGNLPGNFCREIECTEAVIIRPKGAVFGGFVKSDTVEVALRKNECGGCRACAACDAVVSSVARSIKLVMSGVNPSIDTPPTPEAFLNLLKNPGECFVDPVTTFKVVKKGGVPNGMEMNEGEKRYRASRTSREADEFGRITYEPPARLEPGICVMTYPPFVASRNYPGTRIECARSELYKFSTSLRDADLYRLPHEPIDVGYARLARMEALAPHGLLATESGVGSADEPVVNLLAATLPALEGDVPFSPLFDARLETRDWSEEEVANEGSDDDLAAATHATLERSEDLLRKRSAAELAYDEEMIASQLVAADQNELEGSALRSLDEYDFAPRLRKRYRRRVAAPEEEEEEEEEVGVEDEEM